MSTKPDPSLLKAFDAAGGRGPKLAQVKVVWDPSVDHARDLAFQLWPTSGLTGELIQELPTPTHFEQAVAPLRKDDVVESFPCGPDPEVHLDAIMRYFDAGYAEVYVTQVGPNQEEFLRAFAREILPAIQASSPSNPSTADSHARGA